MNLMTSIDTVSLVPYTVAPKPPKKGLKYDVVASTPRRRTVHVSSLSEDRELHPRERQSITSQSRDLLRNFSLAGFAIRKHVQYIADFRFQSRSGNREFDRMLEQKIKKWKKRKNCSADRRHCFDVLIQLIEILRVLDGDVGIMKVDSGLGRVQLIEGDRIRTTTEFPDGWTHGVRRGRYGQDVEYCIHKRLDWGGFEFERNVSADNMLLCGYYMRSDQVRGVSPLTPAITQFSHLYEGIEYALAKAKLAQLLGLITTQSSDDEIFSSTRRFDDDDDEGEGDEESRSEPDGPFAEIPQDNANDNQIREKWGKGILHLQLDEGGDAKLLESQTPSNQFQDFCVQVIRLCLASLDMPYSFYNGENTNFYGSRGDLNNYIGSCQKRQIALKEALEELTDWLLRLWVMDGYLELPGGWKVDDLEYEWRGAGIPYWRLIDDSKGYHEAIQNGLTNPQQVCMEHGTDYYENVDKIAEAIHYANDRDVPVNLAFAAPITSQHTGL